MAYTFSERLTALDLSFLRFEEFDPTVHMHVGAVALFELGPLGNEHGGLDIDRIRLGIEATLGESPRFRQKLASLPLVDTPVWIDDARFNIAYHVRHTALPRPGTVRQLKRLAGRIFSQRLDRSKPLWEFWLVEGLEDGRFALIAKAHHCLVDGMSGFDLLARMMRLDPDPTVTPARPWIPRPAPSTVRLLRGELSRRASLPFDLTGAGLRALGSPISSAGRLRQASAALFEALSANLSPTPPTPLNVDIGPYRRFDWRRFDLASVKEVKERVGGTVNDVVLACVAGAVRRFLAQRGERPDQRSFRAMVPVSIRGEGERGIEGNRVVSLTAQLPIDTADPLLRLERVRETTRRLKRSRQARGVELFEEITDRLSPRLFFDVVRRTARDSYNMVVTNVPGPQTSCWLLGGKMLEVYPLVPLFVGQALGIALFSYNGGLYWGLNADWDALPDLHEFAGFLEEDFEALRKAATASEP